MEQRFCKKCLLKDLSEDTYYKSLENYIENIAPEIKTPSSQYQDRLAHCMECDNLINGMCRICGCFVEIRAAVVHHHCPGVKKVW